MNQPGPGRGDIDELAIEAYRAYGEATGGLSHRGEPMPSWGDLGAPIRAAWRAATQRILDRITGPDAP